MCYTPQQFFYKVNNMQVKNNKIRNIAIIAHVDHGKTTLVDAMLKQSGLFRDNQVVSERLMDNMELEKERGITIAAKNCSIKWKGVKINILDTPGHSDFGGEVERALSMVDGVILLVDASEGPLPQTRFVLDKALKNKLKLIVVINKIDRQDARPKEVLDEIYDLLIDLDATEDQLDFPFAYAVGRDGIAVKTLNEKSDNLHILLDMILDNIPGPTYEENKPFQMLVSYSDYLGRLAIGKIINGSTESKNNLVCIKEDNTLVPLKISKLQVYNGVSITEANIVEAGDIIVLSGISDVNIGDTITTEENPESLPRIVVDEPTVFIEFSVNTSPYAGRDGQFLQSKKIKERLYNESLKNVSIKVEEAANSEKYIVKGRGEFQLAILIEMMRREGFELSVSRPQVIFRNIDGVKCEPIEYLLINCPEEYSGIVTEKLLRKKGILTNMIKKSNGRVRLEFNIPSRALIGYKDEFLTDTHGTGIMNSSFIGYEKYRGDFPARFSGSLVSDRQGKAVAYALGNLEARGKLFIKPGDDVYEGMIIGEYSRDNDLNVNPCKSKKLTNLRAAGKDDAIILAPPIQITLEKAIQFIKEDEMIEITPKVIRLRKTILSAQQRKNN